MSLSSTAVLRHSLPAGRVHVNAHLTQGSPGLTDTNLKVDTFKGELFFLSYLLYSILC